MDTRDVLSRFTAGDLSKDEVLGLLRDRGPGARDGGARERASAPAGGSGPPSGRVHEPVAVIGCSARFPGADDLDAFRRLLREGADTVAEVPRDRWPVERWYDPDPAAPGRSLSRWGGMLRDAADFDAGLFRMTRREAELTDPQARLFLQECRRAVENAGYAPSSLAGSRCGVYAGVMLNDYALRVERSSPHHRMPQVMQGNSQSILAARVAYLLDLAGPVTSVDTACSSSLVALHLACQALWLGEADMMLAGGVTLYTTEIPYVYMSKAGMLSPTGRCRPFDASADGFVPAEGSAVVLLKTLRRALADGDPVQAVIRASGVNHDGATNGLTAPSRRAQTALVEETYRRFGVDPAGIDYVECHGTGTPLGDPIELAALNAVFAPAGLPAGSVPVGSVKANVGHTSAAAGLAGVFKAMEVLATGRVPATPHFRRANPRIPFAEGPFRVADRPVELVRDGSRPWRVAVSSFGLSGTNAHVVLEEPPAVPAPAPVPGPVLVVLSAHEHALLAAQARVLADWLEGPGAGTAPADVARTLAVGRDHHRHRLAVVAETADDLREALTALAQGRPPGRWVASPPDGADGAPGDGGAGTPVSEDARRAREPLPERLYDRVAPAGPATADDLLALGRLYVQGHTVRWSEVFPPGRGRVVPMPGSVLATDRFWIEEDLPAPERGTTAPATAPASAPATGPSAGAPHAASAPAAPAPGPAGVSLYAPHWVPVPVAPDGVTSGPLLVVGPAELAAGLEARWSGPVHVLAADGAPPADLAPATAHGADERVTLVVVVPPAGSRHWWAPLFGPVRQVLTGLWRRTVHVLAVATDRATALAAGGFVQTLAHENPRLTGRALLLDRAGAAEADPIAQEAADPAPGSGRIVDRRAGRRLSRLLAPVETPTAAPPGTDAPFLPGEVYLVTGGLGGLGLLTARHLLGHGARVVLCGRRAPEALARADRDALTALGGDVRYVPTDVTDEDAVRDLVDGVLRVEGRLDGVFHAAGTLRDAYLVRKRPEEADAVIGPKARGVRALDAATAGLGLRMFVLFSSLSGAVGNLGQSDYATGNGFLDGFAEQRRAAVARGERSGRTLSVAWPLWRDGGMTVPDAVLAAMRERTGAEPLPSAPGLAALEALLRLPEDACLVAVFHGERSRWEATLRAFSVLGTVRPQAGRTSEPEPGPPSGPGGGAGAGAGTGPRHRRVADLVRRAVTEVTGTPEGAVRMDAPLESLGLDSVTIRSLAATLSRTVGRVEGAEVFTAPSLSALAALLADRTDDDAPAAAPRPDLPAPSTPSPGPAPATPAPLPARAPSAPSPDPVPSAHGPHGSHGGPGSGPALAVVGMSGRYPGARDLTAFLRGLREGRDSSGPLPAGRWAAGGTGTEDVRGHFLEDVDRFDPELFGLSAHESALVDPQERLFLEAAWEALEDAGALGERLDGLRDDSGEPRSVGVFVGVTSSDYQKVGVEAWGGGNRTVPGGHYWSVANRVSYLLDLRGPSQPVDTACSSSLVALHLAAEAIARGECAAAVVGGVNLYLHPSRMLLLKEFGFLSPDGRCRSFGAGGTGFGPGEGVGALVVKPLARALADGDRVYAVVRGTAVAHAGRGHGYTAPSPRAQARVIRRALARGGVDPASVGLVEAHGTGTELGDPVEVAALTEVFGGRPADRRPIALGSVKSQVGHGESVAGLAALTKVVLSLRNRELLPTLHADPVNPALGLDPALFTLTTEGGDWPDDGLAPRRAGVSSFGAGGVNAHAVLEEYVPEDGARPAATPAGPGGEELVLLRAPTPDHLAALAGRLADWLEDTGGPGPGVDLRDLAYTLRCGRAEQPCRLAVTVRGVPELARVLAAVAASGARGETLPPGVHLNDVRVTAADPESFRDDAALRAFVASLWAAGDVGRVGRLWTQGVPVRWTDLTAPGRIVSLPPTVFLRRRIWVTTTSADRPSTSPAPDPEAPTAPAVPPAPPEPSAPSTLPARNGGRSHDRNEGRSDGREDGRYREVLGRLEDLVLPRVPGRQGRVDADRSLVEAGMDSVNLMSLRFAAEEEFGVELPLDLLGGDAPLTAIARRIASASAAPAPAPRPPAGTRSGNGLPPSLHPSQS
ncbi:SDR family NAD(P)-dependent oxidoreductase [Streptomyces sp. enrichment culture]|uniref:SDR family NAD(P)-dependent oxidoreductase n=1 Tax=Streptomyces sp. enrichment culture TaxID=1795815 RepID=UPI003F57817E